MYRHCLDADWAKRGVGDFAMALAPIKNQSQYSQLNSLLSRNNEYDSVVVLVQ
jgi:hypothetical protein